MNFEIHNLFPTPIAIGRYDYAEETKNKLVPVFKEIEQKYAQGVSGKFDKRYGFGYTSFFDIRNILDLEVCADLKQYISKWVNKFHTQHKLQDKLKLSASWFTINRLYSYHGLHCHTGSAWSGVYYVSCKKEDASLTFVNPTSFQTRTLTSPEKKEFSFETGNLIIFPSYAIHSVNQQLTDNERINIAFNFDID